VTTGRRRAHFLRPAILILELVIVPAVTS